MRHIAGRVQVVQREFASMGGRKLLDALPSTIAYKWSSPETGGNRNGGETDATFNKRPHLAQDSMAFTRTTMSNFGLTARQEQVSEHPRCLTVAWLHLAD